jgi:hypothetical protein
MFGGDGFVSCSASGDEQGLSRFAGGFDLGYVGAAVERVCCLSRVEAARYPESNTGGSGCGDAAPDLFGDGFVAQLQSELGSPLGIR